MRAGVSVWPHHGKGPRQGDVRSQATRTTRPLPLPALLSRGCRTLAEGRQVPPIVGLIQWMLVIDGITAIDLGSSMAGQQGSQGLIQERRVVQLFSKPSRALDQPLVDGRAHSHSWHAPIMPLLCHQFKTHRILSVASDTFATRSKPRGGIMDSSTEAWLDQAEAEMAAMTSCLQRTTSIRGRTNTPCRCFC